MNNNTSVRVRSAATTKCAVAEPDRPIWFPGSTPPAWLDGSLPGDFGFDPLGLGKINNHYTNFMSLKPTWVY